MSAYLWASRALIVRPKTAEPDIEFLLAPSRATTPPRDGRRLKCVPVALRGGGVSLVGRSLAFEYTVVQRGWSRIASDVFRFGSWTQRDVEAASVANAHHPGLRLTFECYRSARKAFSPPHATTQETEPLAAVSMDLHILDHRLRVTSISKNGLVNFTHPLIKLIFLRNRTR